MKNLRNFNENNSEEVLKYLKYCFIDLIDELGIMEEDDDADDDDEYGIYIGNSEENIFQVNIDRYKHDLPNDYTFDYIINYNILNLEYLKNIKNALDRFKIKYPKCKVELETHDFYEISIEV